MQSLFWAAPVALSNTAVALHTPRNASLVRKEEFSSVAGETYLNSARIHPLPRVAVQALCGYARSVTSTAGFRERAAAAFARFVNVEASAVALVPSTMTAENLVLASLGLPRAGANIVTDTLHFHGSLFLYDMLARQGIEIRRVAHREGRVELEALDAAIDRRTHLVALSVVSSVNGFRHDLSAVCERAHAKGALVYADAIHAVGAIPLDLTETRVDFCAAGTHKWMMGGEGLAFLYVHPDLLARGVITPPQHGWVQLDNDPPLAQFSAYPETAHWRVRRGAGGQFEVGTYATGTALAVTASLGYLHGIGVSRIQQHAHQLAARLRQALPSLGYECLSPPDAVSHISAFRISDREQLQQRLARARIRVRIGLDAMRVSTSIFNDLGDIERLIDALK